MQFRDLSSLTIQSAMLAGTSCFEEKRKEIRSIYSSLRIYPTSFTLSYSILHFLIEILLTTRNHGSG